MLAFAHDEPGRGWTPAAEQVTAAQDGDAWTLTGVKEPVPHGARADVLVVSAALPDGGTGLFVVAGDEAERTGYPTYDGTRAARVAFDGTAATPLGEPGADLTNSISTVQDITRVMAANQALGAMQFLLPTTTEYLRSRKQFGVPLSHLPGADLPRRGHVRLAGADPLDGRLGDDGGRPGVRPASRAWPTRPAGSRSRSAGPAGTSARRRSSCTAASR